MGTIGDAETSRGIFGRTQVPSRVRMFEEALRGLDAGTRIVLL